MSEASAGDPGAGRRGPIPPEVDGPRTARGRILSRRTALLLVVLSSYLFILIFINPLRAGITDYDDWAYALSVRHLLETGRYYQHDYASANMPFQIYWGAAFASVFGYSLAILRASTLVMMTAGLVAFYFLAREHGLGPVPAALLVLGLMASPLILRLSFTFMTDIPFLSCLIIALLLYTRAIRLRSAG